jgi:hypothetical protein
MINYETYQSKMDAAKDAEQKAETALKRADLSPEQRENLFKQMMQRAAQLRKDAMRYAQ